MNNKESEADDPDEGVGAQTELTLINNDENDEIEESPNQDTNDAT